MCNFSRVRRLGMRIAVLIFAVATGVSPTWAQAMLGVSLPATPASTITQGGSPNFADTYVTPFVATKAGTITAWKAQFTAGTLANGGCGVPVGIQLKILRQTTSPGILTVVKAGAVNNPKTIFSPTGCPSFADGSPGSVIQFTESAPGLDFLAGDIIGLTIQSDPTVGGYFYPLVSAGNTRLVTSNVPVGGTIDLNSSGLLTGLAPALQTTGAPWKLGDVFVAIGKARYQVYRVSGSPPTATLIDTIIDGLSDRFTSGGFTTGCAFDSTYHLYTTNFSNRKVVKFDPAPPHPVQQTISTGTTSMSLDSESIVFDGKGNFYVGHADSVGTTGAFVFGGGKLEKYTPGGALLQTFAPVVDGRGTDWIDLTADGTTIYYTSEGRKIKRFNVSTGTQLADFVNLGTTAGTLYALRLLPPGDGTGGLLVADSNNIKRFDASGTLTQVYSVSGEVNFFALNLDPNGTSFWAGDFGTGHFYRFNISSGAVEVGPVSTGAPGGLFGTCVYGGFGAAQAQPTVQTFSLTPTNNSATAFNDNNSNATSVTLNGLAQSATLTVSFSKVNPDAFFAANGQHCVIVTSDGNCAVQEIDADTTNYTLAHLYHGWVRKGTVNPHLFRFDQDITTAQNIDPGVCGDTFPLSPYTDRELPLPTGATNCGFFPPVANGAVFNLGDTIAIKFTATGGDCSTGPLITAASGAQPRLSVAKVVPGFPPVPQPVTASGTSSISNLFTFNDENVWIYNWSTKGLTSGDYIVTAFDLTNHIPPASVRIALR